MENIGTNVFEIKKLLESNQKILLGLTGCGLSDIKKLTQANFPYMMQYKGAFCCLQAERVHVDATINTALDMLCERNLISMLPGTTFVETFSVLKQSGINKVFFVVKDMQRRNEIIAAGKETKVFIDFCKLNEDGSISKWPVRVGNTIKTYPNTKVYNSNYQRTAVYTIKNKPEQVDIRRINVIDQIGIGNILYDTEGKSYTILEKVLNNNGATTYKTDVTGIWVKLYDDNNINTFIESKIKRMLMNPLKYRGLCWPLSLALDSKQTFRGYFMEAASGEPFHLSVLKKAGIENNYPHWNKINLCELAITILDKIDFLHRNGILMGCINPAAIRVVDDKTVYFTDTDNYQVEGYPSFVYNISFTPPELLGKRIYLTDRDSENFAVAELLFMILMTGKTPYAVGLNGKPEEEIKRMNFPYSNRELHADKALPSMWRFMWSHLSPFKSPFYETFQKNGRFNVQGTRRNAGFWIRLVKNFKTELENPIDIESLKLYPHTFKRGPNDVFYKCSYCGVEHPRFYFNNKYFDEYRICNDCIDKQSKVSFTCQDCGKTYYYTNRTALFHKQKREQDSDWKDQKHCWDCKRKTLTCKRCGKEVPFYYLKDGLCSDCRQQTRNDVVDRIKCKNCGEWFDFTKKERIFYAKQGWDEPRTCPNCRKNKNAPKKGFFSWLFGN